jgi:hypothetical protein
LPSWRSNASSSGESIIQLSKSLLPDCAWCIEQPSWGWKLPGRRCLVTPKREVIEILRGLSHETEM